VDKAVGGNIIEDPRTNSLIITERPTRMKRIRPVIDQLDRPTDQVMIESKFVEITNNDVRNLGVNWSSLSSYSLTATPGSGGIYTYTNTYGSGLSNSNSTEPTPTTRRPPTRGPRPSRTRRRSRRAARPRRPRPSGATREPRSRTSWGRWSATS
jgi:type IV pilus assembly protein PilQ